MGDVRPRSAPMLIKTTAAAISASMTRPNEILKDKVSKLSLNVDDQFHGLNGVINHKVLR